MASCVLLILVYCGGVALLGKNKFQEHELERKTFWLLSGGILLFGLALRIWLGLTSEGFSADMDTFKAWARITNEVGFHRIYQEDIFLDYPPGYLYVLTLLEKWRLLLGIPAASPAFTLMMKLPSILADLLCAGALLFLGRRKLGERGALFLLGVYLFCPAVFLNSAQWGQADSFCTLLLLCSVLLLYREKYLPCAALYGAAIACKPQMLVFAPLYLFFVWRKRKIWMPLWGVLCAVGTLLLIATPFTRNFQYLWLIEKYQSTMDYYHYYSVNAYNLWALLGMNWTALPEGALGTVLNLTGPAAATALCAVLMIGSKREDAVFACPYVLMSAMYFFSVKMHERYLFPALLFLLLSYVYSKDRRLLWTFSLVALGHYLNVSYVLWQFQTKGANYDPNTFVTRGLAGLQALAFCYLLYVTWDLYLRNRAQEGEVKRARPLPQIAVRGRLTRLDALCMALVTLCYGAVAFIHLGDRETAVTPWTPKEGESVVVRGEGALRELTYLPGISSDEAHYSYRVGASVQVESSEDGLHWEDCGTLSESSVFAWKQFSLPKEGSYIRLTPLDGSVTLNEIGLKLSGENRFSALTLIEGKGEALLDEQEVLPYYSTYENSTYFDEIYHARTAYEHLLGLEIYETTHPTLGKLIISLGIRLFGMNPFGWRFMGTLFGVLMLPVFYHLLKQLLKKTSLSLAGTVLFAFDFMHFTQTRIATIDTYAVFFLLLMYDAMTVFLFQDLKRERLWRMLVPLGLCGVFTGLGIASKWTAAYGAAGLAVLFFGKLIFACARERRESGDLRPLVRKSGILCLWCCLFFLVIPFLIYFAAFLPLTTLPHNRGQLWPSFVNYQINMFRYHSGLVAEHTFASSWYEWPLDIRPIWYYANSNCNALGQYSTISAMGNPVLWWTGLLGIFFAFFLWWKKRSLAAGVAAAGFLSVYLPWTLVPRLTFIYHYFTAVPFLVLGLMLLFSKLSQLPFLQRGLMREGALSRFSVGEALLLGFTALQLGLFCLYFPVISGAPTTESYVNSLELFHTWVFAWP